MVDKKTTEEGGDILKIFLGIIFTSTWSVEKKQLTEVQWAAFNTNDAKIESQYRVAATSPSGPASSLQP